MSIMRMGIKDMAKETDLWIEENPEGWCLIRRFAKNLGENGRRFGMQLVIERARWEMHFDYDKKDFKINNNHVAYMARRLIAEFPQLESLIKLRRAKDEKEI